MLPVDVTIMYGILVSVAKWNIQKLSFCRHQQEIWVVVRRIFGMRFRYLIKVDHIEFYQYFMVIQPPYLTAPHQVGL